MRLPGSEFDSDIDLNSDSKIAAKPEPNGSDGGEAENLPAKIEKPLSPLKDEVANYWQDLITGVQPHTTWSNFGQERGQPRNLFETFLYLTQHSKNKKIRESPIIPSQISFFGAT